MKYYIAGAGLVIANMAGVGLLVEAMDAWGDWVVANGLSEGVFYAPVFFVFFVVGTAIIGMILKHSRGDA